MHCDQQCVVVCVPVIISNPLYEPRYTSEWYTAFTQFAMAAMKHYQGVGIIWELWNEVGRIRSCVEYFPVHCEA